MNKALAFLTGAVVAIGCSAVVLGADNAAPTTAAKPAADIVIDNYAFKPAKVSVCAGQTVAWKNNDDDPHTVTAADASFESKGLGQGDSFSHEFPAAGTYAYFCKVHPYMKAVVVVTKCK